MGGSILLDDGVGVLELFGGDWFVAVSFSDCGARFADCGF